MEDVHPNTLSVGDKIEVWFDGKVRKSFDGTITEIAKRFIFVEFYPHPKTEKNDLYAYSYIAKFRKSNGRAVQDYYFIMVSE